LHHPCAAQATLGDSLAAMEPRAFERLLHPIFEEDELTLIAVGGALGAAAAWLQLALGAAAARRARRAGGRAVARARSLLGALRRPRRGPSA
jgi:hypothetical protein